MRKHALQVGGVRKSSPTPIRMRRVRRSAVHPAWHNGRGLRLVTGMCLKRESAMVVHGDFTVYFPFLKMSNVE